MSKTLSIDLCGTEWEVEFDSFLEEDGLCNHDWQLIRINDDRVKHRQSLALTHELLHVVFDHAGIDDDEEVIKRIEHGVLDLVRNFPEEYK